MNYLSLFSGVEGGGLAFQHLIEPKWRCLGYVEFDEYCQAVLAQRINDGYLNPAPIFGDIRRFIAEGYAEAYQGMVDIITAGFPCQPWSVGNTKKTRGETDERNLWPETAKTIRLVRPKFIFLENVSGLLAHQYIQRIFADLAQLGYNSRWCRLSASVLGFAHLRKRIWIVAYPRSFGWFRLSEKFQSHTILPTFKGKTSLQTAALVFRAESEYEGNPDNTRIGDGIPEGMDRLKAIGNGQVPQVAATAWEILSDD